MKKYKMRHYETLNADLFPQAFPQGKNGGETSLEPQMVYDQEPQMDRNKEPKQPTLAEIWQWFGNPDKY